MTALPLRGALTAFLLLIPLCPVQLPDALAANGDLVHTTRFSNPCSSGIGVGVAFDGEFLWYSCYSSTPDLYKAEALTGTVVASYTIAGGLGALAWDGRRKMIWAGWGGGFGGDGDVRLINPSTGAAEYISIAGNARHGLPIGLAYDAWNDTLYISDDFENTIYHYQLIENGVSTTSATLIRSFPSAVIGCSGPKGGGGSRGLAIGGGLLFEGSIACSSVWAVNHFNLGAEFDFPIVGLHGTDLECDSVTFSPRTVMWSLQESDENFGDLLGRRAIAFEIPPASCGTGGGVDSDGDGLLDEWEANGVWIDPGGNGSPQFIDLPAMGADKNKPDIFLHIDWMVADPNDPNDVNHALAAAAIQRVVTAFANASYTSPTGSVGINLHVDQGPGSILDFSTNTTWGALSRAGALPHVSPLGTGGGNGQYQWSAFQAIKDRPGGFTDTGRTPIFHYVIAAHNYGDTTSSGISRGIGASDFIVSLGSFGGGSVTAQAGTLMHELGHNLNLHHGGGDDLNYKLNYLSVMNYLFQLEGLIVGGVSGGLDYSRSALAVLDETQLNEPTGLGPAAAGLGTYHFWPGLNFVPVADADGPIDWNCNGLDSDTGVTFDVNFSGGLEMFTGYDDWVNVKLRGGAIGLAGVTPGLPMETEEEVLTVEAAKKIPPLSVQTLTGSASRVGVVPLPGKDTGAQVNVVGKSGLAGPVNLASSRLTIERLLDEGGGGGAGELAKGTGGADILPITLAARPGSTANAAIFETPPRSRPILRIEIKNRDPRKALLEFTLRLDGAAIPAFPALCAGSSPATHLATSFRIDDGVNPPVVVSTVRAWRCSDLIGRDPQKPRSLRTP